MVMLRALAYNASIGLGRKSGNAKDFNIKYCKPPVSAVGSLKTNTALGVGRQATRNGKLLLRSEFSPAGSPAFEWGGFI